MPLKNLKKCIVLATLLIASCSVAPSSSDLEAQQSNPMGGFSPLSILPSVLQPYRNDPSWPKFPRADFQHQTVISHSDAGEVGIKAGIAGIVEAGTSLKVALERRTLVTTILMASNDAEKGENIFDLSQLPAVRIDYWEGRDMIVFCLLSASHSLSDSWAGKLKFSSPGKFLGGGGEANYEKIISSTTASTYTQTSKMRRPLVGESTDQVIKSCEDFAQNENVQSSVLNGLQAGIVDAHLDLAGSVCIQDDHCTDKFLNVLPTLREWTTPRCIQQPNTNFFCELKGKEGMNCPFYRKDKEGKKVLVTSGMFERECDAKADLECVLYEEPTFLSSGKAKCMPKKMQVTLTNSTPSK